MFNLRKILLVALVVVILLGFFMGSRVDLNEVIQFAGGAKALDPTRPSAEMHQGIEIAGGAKALDPTGRIQG